MLKRFSRFFQTSQLSPQQRGAIQGPYTDLRHLMALRYDAKTLLLPKSQRISRPQSGSHRSKFRGRGMEFSEVRLYQPGDDVRSIDWRVTARRQKPHTKLYDEERERPVFVLCDQRMSQFFGSQQTFKSVRALEVMALFAWTAIDHGDRVGGLVFSDAGHSEVKPARNRRSLMQLLHEGLKYHQNLNIHQPAGDSQVSLHAALVETQRLVKPGTLIVVISDFYGFGDSESTLLKAMGKHNEVLLVRTHDPLEDSLPPPGLYAVSDGHAHFRLNTRDPQNRARYQQWAQQQQQRIADTARRLRTPFMQVSTHGSPTQALRPALLSLGA